MGWEGDVGGGGEGGCWRWCRWNACRIRSVELTKVLDKAVEEEVDEKVKDFDAVVVVEVEEAAEKVVEGTLRRWKQRLRISRW